jgi:hypothetical protein
MKHANHNRFSTTDRYSSTWKEATATRRERGNRTRAERKYGRNYSSQKDAEKELPKPEGNTEELQQPEGRGERTTAAKRKYGKHCSGHNEIQLKPI